MQRSLRKPCKLFFSLLHPPISTAFLVDVYRPAPLFFGFSFIAFLFEQLSVYGIVSAQVELHAVSLVCLYGLFDPMLGFGKVLFINDQKNFAEVSAHRTFIQLYSVISHITVEQFQVNIFLTA